MTSTELAVYPRQTSLELAPSAWKLAEKIAGTDFVPTALRGRPEAVLACILAGHELGIGPMQALSKIHIIEGRPAMAAELMRALVLQAGHELEYADVSITSVTAEGRRRGSDRWTRVTWTADDVKRGQLDQKPNHRKWPRAMLIARATAELCRMIFPDVLAGISYTIEELSDGDGPAGLVDFGPPELVEARSAPAGPAPKTAQAQRQVTRPAPEDDPAPAPAPARGEVPDLPEPAGPIVDAEVVEAKAVEAPTSTEEADDWPSGDWTPADYGPQAEPEQQRRYTGPQLIAMRLADKFGIKGNSAQARAQRIGAISELVGHNIESSKDLTPDEIGLIIATLDAMPDGTTLDEVAGHPQEAENPAPEPPPESPASEPSAPATPAPPRRSTPPPEDWTADKWREVLNDRKVKVTEAIKEAQKIGSSRDPKVSIITLEDLAGSGIAGDLLGYVEDLGLDRRAKK